MHPTRPKRPADFDGNELLRELKQLKLNIPLGQLLALVPHYRKKLLKQLAGKKEPESESAALTCEVDLTANWDMTVPKLTSGVVVDNGSGFNIRSDKTRKSLDITTMDPTPFSI